MKRIYILILVTLFGCTTAKSQRVEVVKLADSLRWLSRQTVSYKGMRPSFLYYEKKLRELATNDELIYLAQKHRNAAVRAFCFQELVIRGDVRYKDVLHSLLNDNKRFSLEYFDSSGIVDNVANYMINVLIYKVGYMSEHDSIYFDSIFQDTKMIKKYPYTYNNYINTPKISDFRRIFSIQDSLILDSILFFTPNTTHINHLIKVIDNYPLTEDNYKRLYELLNKEKFHKALPALCRYRKDETKPIVNKYFKDIYIRKGNHGGRTDIGLKAISFWPDKDFIPALIRVRDYEVSREFYNYQRIKLLYLAFMAYDDELSYQLIDETLNMAKEAKVTSTYYWHKIHFKEAFDENPNPRYLPLVEKYCDSKSKE